MTGNPDLPDLAEQIAATAYFVVAEAVTNTLKHAAAGRIRVLVGHDDDRPLVTIDDDGRGGADATAGTGLVGLRDRVAAVGGELSIRSTPGGGTTVHARLPLRQL